MIIGVPMELKWTEDNCCHINNYGWIVIKKHIDGVNYKAEQIQNMIPYIGFPEYSEENKFTNVDDAKKWVQEHLDKCWRILSDIKIIR